MLFAARQWRTRPHASDEVATPKWMGALDGFGVAKALGAGVLLSALNPKNLLLIVGGTAAVAQFGLSTGDQVIAWAVFTVLASLGVATPLAIFVGMGTRAAAILDRLKTWMALPNAA